MKKKHSKRSNTKLQDQATPTSMAQIKHKNLYLFIVILLIICVIALSSISSNMKSAFGSNAAVSQVYTIEVVNEFPHDPNAFTQGLLYAENDTLFESTGLYGRSSVRKVDLQTGKVMALQKMQRSYFGEGLTLLGDRLFQVTWLRKTGFIYHRSNLSKFEMFSHQMQDGWGLATNGKILFGSDGTSTLYQIDPQTFRATGKQIVKYNGHEVHNLNELEYINGEVWANVWQTDCIARIAHKTGKVLGWILLHQLREGLVASGTRGIDVLNGIAWDSDKNRLFVTGKLWPQLYEIKLQPLKTPFDGDVEQMCMPMPSHFPKP